MNQKEILILSVGIFLTIIAWMLIDIYQLQNKHLIDKDIKGVNNLQFKIDDQIFKTLKERK